MSKFAEILEAVETAKTDPSPTCPKADEHDFKSVMHMDGRDSYTWVYQCSHCGEYVKKTQKRRGLNKKYWS